MKAIGSKFALPVASVVAILALVGVQAMALSNSPSDEISTPAGSEKKVAGVTSDRTTTPIEIPTDGSQTIPEDNELEDSLEDADDDGEDFEDDSFDDESEDSFDDDHNSDDSHEDEEGDDD